MTRRTIVILLALIAGVSGELLAAVSMTRIAGPRAVELGQTVGALGFPYDLRWTLFAVVSVAGWVGAVLWTSPRENDRRVGPWLNLPAAVIAGIAVGLDHGVHADPTGPWRVLAFLTGPLITLTASAMLHVIARMTTAPHVGTAGSSGVRSGDSGNFPGGNPDVDTYKATDGATYNPPPVEHELADDDAPTPPDGISTAPALDEARARVQWALDRPEVPSWEAIAEQFTVSKRTAQRTRSAALQRRERAS